MLFGADVRCLYYELNTPRDRYICPIKDQRVLFVIGKDVYCRDVVANVSDSNVSALRRDGFVKILEINFLVQICLIFILAGLVKGVVGFGLPTIGIGLGALISDIPTAMMLILVPTFFTNIVQVLAPARWPPS